MSTTTMLQRTTAVVAAGLLASCGTGPAVEGDLSGEPGVQSRRDFGFQNQGFQNQGFQNQGFQNQGTSGSGAQALIGFQLQSLLGGTGSKADRVDLVQGDLTISRSTQAWNTASYSACTTTSWGYGRKCGFDPAGVGSCTPYTTVTLGAAPTCGGACSGDPVMRVCSGNAPCESGTSSMLVQGDDSCGTLCPLVSFVCPASGTYSVMTGPYNTASPGYAIDLHASSGTYPLFTSVTHGTDLANVPVIAEMESGGTIPMRLVRAVPELEAAVPLSPRPHGQTYRYEVTYTDANGNLAELCGPDDYLNAEYPAQPVALPVPGAFDHTGAFIDTPRLFTFACRTGVISKCYRWGYRPWDSTGIPGDTTAKKMLTACTRMARADYCGTGDSYTRYGTLINVFDRLSPAAQVSAPAPTGLFFEAGWRDTGAVCLSHTRWDDAPPSVFTCPQLQQTRGRDGGRAECNNVNEALFFGTDVRLMNESDFNKAPK